MAEYYGDFDEDATVLLDFNTFSSNDPSASVTITDLVAADIKVHKDGNATPIVTDGATIAIDFATVTGQHLITIDTSVDAAYAVGSDYNVRIEGATVDGATINAWIGSFSIENRHSATANAAIQSTVDAIPTTAMRGTDGVDTATMRGTDSALLAASAPTNFGDMSISVTTGLVDITQTAADKMWSTTTRALTDKAGFGVSSLAANTITAASIATSAMDGKGNWNIGKTGYSLTQTFPSNFADLSIVATTGLVNITQVAADKVWGTITRVLTASTNFNDLSAAQVNAEVDTALADYDGPTNAEMEARTPTAAQLAYITANAATAVPVTFTTSGGSATIAVLNQVDGAAASSTDDQYNGRLLVFNAGTLFMVATDITDYDGTTKQATITAIPFAPTASHTARLV